MNTKLEFEQKIFVQRQPWTDNLLVLVKHLDRVRHKVYHGILTLNEVPDNVESGQPTLQLSPTDAQRFMDELWNCGIRPSEGTGSAGALAATQRHLEDMRTLVFQPTPKIVEASPMSPTISL